QFKVCDSSTRGSVPIRARALYETRATYRACLYRIHILACERAAGSIRAIRVRTDLHHGPLWDATRRELRTVPARSHVLFAREGNGRHAIRRKRVLGFHICDRNVFTERVALPGCDAECHLTCAGNSTSSR